jgi:hypothetical protein
MTGTYLMLAVSFALQTARLVAMLNELADPSASIT